jgi:hypothetical protein
MPISPPWSDHFPHAQDRAACGHALVWAVLPDDFAERGRTKSGGVSGMIVAEHQAFQPPTAPSAVAARDMGKASGAINTLQRFGGAFGVAIVSAVFAANGHLGTAASVSAGFRRWRSAPASRRLARRARWRSATRRRPAALASAA